MMIAVSSRLPSPLASVVCALGIVLTPPARSQDSWLPDAAYVQHGQTVRDTRAVVAGVIWDWRNRWPILGGELSGYWEFALGHWRTPSPPGTASAVVTQVSLTPTFRWRPQDGSSPWFAEAAIGFTAMTPIYENRDKQFSTAFNFADHVAIGRNFGQKGRHELVLRYEHFSNGGIRHPNPGENFWQLRYARRWD
jgi:lipid A 3-O-deacylase